MKIRIRKCDLSYYKLIRKVPNWLRKTVSVMAFLVVACLPALALMLAGARQMMILVNNFFKMDFYSAGSILIMFMTSSLIIFFLLPLIKKAYHVIHEWNIDIDLSK